MTQNTNGARPSPMHAAAVTVELEPSSGLPSPLYEIMAQTVSSSSGGSAPDENASATPRKPKKPRGRLASASKPTVVSAGDVVVGTLAGFNDDGEPLVRHPLDPTQSLVRARSVVPLDFDQVDRELAIAFERGDTGKPIVLGVVWQPAKRSPDPRSRQLPDTQIPVAASVDGEQLVFSADREIVLKCGEASITLTRAGKVLIRGTYLLSRSSGVNRIKGGSVQIN
jgi:Domain of unknown function (DUF6484)